MGTKFKILIGAVLFAGIFQSCEFAGIFPFFEKTSPITTFTASQGDFIGVVHLVVEEVENKENYSYERKNPQTDQWEQIFWGPENIYDDNGWDLLYYSLLPGQVYEYRVRAHTDKNGYGKYSEVVTGHIFSPNPYFEKLEYKEIEGDPGSYNLNYRIVDELPFDVKNLISRTITVRRAESYDMYFNDMQILELHMSNYPESIIVGTKSNVPFDKGKEYYYTIVTFYTYSRFDGNGEYTEDYYTHESRVFVGWEL